MGVDQGVPIEFFPHFAIISLLFFACAWVWTWRYAQNFPQPHFAIISPLLLFCVRVGADLEVGHGEQGQQREGHEVQQGRLRRSEHFRRHRRCQETCAKDQSMAVRNAAPFLMTAELNFYGQTSSF